MVSKRIRKNRVVVVRGKFREKTDTVSCGEVRGKDNSSGSSDDESETEVGDLELRLDRGCSRKVESRNLHVAVSCLWSS